MTEWKYQKDFDRFMEQCMNQMGETLQKWVQDKEHLSPMSANISYPFLLAQNDKELLREDLTKVIADLIRIKNNL